MKTKRAILLGIVIWIIGILFYSISYLIPILEHTVPFFVMPNGGDHYSFFTSIGFWIIAFEFLLVASLYWYARVYSKNSVSNQ